MTDAPSYDWSEITGRAVQRLKARKIVPVPEPIVRQAQRSYDGVTNPENPEELLHVLEHDFRDKDRAAEFAKLMKHAGNHTMPQTTVSVVIDPENVGSLTVVRWRAGEKRGPKS